MILMSGSFWTCGFNHYYFVGSFCRTRHAENKIYALLLHFLLFLFRSRRGPKFYSRVKGIGKPMQLTSIKLALNVLQLLQLIVAACTTQPKTKAESITRLELALYTGRNENTDNRATIAQIARSPWICFVMNRINYSWRTSCLNWLPRSS